MAALSNLKRKVFEDDRLTILRAAIEFKKRRGAPPTKATSAEFFENVKQSLSENLSESQVLNKLRHLKDKRGKPSDLVLRLSAELWGPIFKKKENEKEVECWDCVKGAVTEYWKANGLSSIALVEGLQLADAAKARELEEKWRRLMTDEMRLLVDWSKASRDMLVMLHEAHRDVKI